MAAVTAVKNCPRCAEEIRAEALMCRYCGQEFTVRHLGYCATCHARVDVSSGATCLTCGTPLIDITLDSVAHALPPTTGETSSVPLAPLTAGFANGPHSAAGPHASDDGGAKRRGMKVAVFVLALIGGILALLGTATGLGLTGLAAGLGADETETRAVGGRLLLGFVLAVATIVAGSMVLTSHSGRRWGIVLIAVSLIGSVAAGGFYVIGGLLGLIAGVIAFFVRPTRAPGSHA